MSGEHAWPPPLAWAPCPTSPPSSSRPGSSRSATCPAVRRGASPDKLAIVDGDDPADLRRARRGSSTGPPRRWPRPGLAKGDRLALLSPQLLAVRGARLRRRPGRRGAGAGQLHARRRRDRLHPRPQRRRRRSSSRTRWSPRRRPGAWPPASGTVATARSSSALAGGGAPDGLDRRRRRGSTTTAPPPRWSVADDDPVRMMFTSGTESRPKGALLSQPVAAVAVRLLRARRRR